MVCGGVVGFTPTLRGDSLLEERETLNPHNQLISPQEVAQSVLPGVYELAGRGEWNGRSGREVGVYVGMSMNRGRSKGEETSSRKRNQQTAADYDVRGVESCGRVREGRVGPDSKGYTQSQR